MTATLADHARRGAQEARDLLFRVQRVQHGYEQRPATDARNNAIDVLRVNANRLDDLAFYLDALAHELDQEQTTTRGATRAAEPTDDVRSAAA